MNDIREIVNDIETLKPIPPVAAQVLALADDPNSSMSEIADLIIHDPAITANLLRVCNSAYFSPSRKVESVRDAITLLGLDHMVDLVLLNSISENLKLDQKGALSIIMCEIIFCHILNKWQVAGDFSDGL